MDDTVFDGQYCKGQFEREAKEAGGNAFLVMVTGDGGGCQIDQHRPGRLYPGRFAGGIGGHGFHRMVGEYTGGVGTKVFFVGFGLEVGGYRVVKPAAFSILAADGFGSGTSLPAGTLYRRGRRQLGPAGKNITGIVVDRVGSGRDMLAAGKGVVFKRAYPDMAGTTYSAGRGIIFGYIGIRDREGQAGK